MPLIQRRITDLASTSESDFDVATSLDDACQVKEFVLISDSTGMTAQTAISKCLSQFDWSDDECVVTEVGEVCKIKRSIHTFVRTEEDVAGIIRQAKSRGAMATFTFADPSLRAATVTLCEKEGVPFVDLMGPMLLRMKDFLKMTPNGQPRNRVALNR